MPAGFGKNVCRGINVASCLVLHKEVSCNCVKGCGENIAAKTVSA